MKSTNFSLCAFIVPQAKERCIPFWTRYANLFVWFNNFEVFLIEFGFAIVGCDGEPIFDEKMVHQILNLDAMDTSVNGSKTIVGGRPEVSFHNPHLPMPSLTSAKSLHSSMEFLEVTPQDTVCDCALAVTVESDSRRKEEALLQVLAPCAQHTWQVWM